MLVLTTKVNIWPFTRSLVWGDTCALNCTNVERNLFSLEWFLNVSDGGLEPSHKRKKTKTRNLVNKLHSISQLNTKYIKLVIIYLYVLSDSTSICVGKGWVGLSKCSPEESLVDVDENPVSLVLIFDLPEHIKNNKSDTFCFKF